AETVVEQADRPVVRIEVQLEADAEQDVARVTLIRHARIADSADEDGVVLVAQPRVAARWNGFAGSQIVIGSVRQSLEIEGAARRGADGAKHLHRLRRDIAPDPIAWNDGYTRHRPL